MTVLGQGGAPLGDLYEQISNTQAEACLEAAHAAGITLYDTSPWYGLGLSEMRFGLALHRKPRDSFVLQTKLGRDLLPRAPHRARRRPAGGLRFSYRHEYTAEAFARQLEGFAAGTGSAASTRSSYHDLEPGAAGGGFADGFADPARALARARAHARVCRDGGFALLGARDAQPARSARSAPASTRPSRARTRRPSGRGTASTSPSCCRGAPTPTGAGSTACCSRTRTRCSSTAGSSSSTRAPRPASPSSSAAPFSSGILVTGADPPDAATNPPRFNYEPRPRACARGTRARRPRARATA